MPKKFWGGRSLAHCDGDDQGSDHRLKIRCYLVINCKKGIIHSGFSVDGATGVSSFCHQRRQGSAILVKVQPGGNSGTGDFVPFRS